ncbi:MAG: nucleoside-diphosphate kinase [Planctomycetota bacterium]|nr:nucleoside-diphosphate kinase [Planctomycetota bacterium]
MERTLIILKPDSVQRRLAGKILARFEAKGLQLAALKLLHVDEALARKLYVVHEGKPFYESLVSFITRSPVIAVVIEASRAIEVCRKMMGATFGFQAEPGTIRGDFGISNQYNLIHGSDSPESVEREIPLFFTPSEIHSYSTADAAWLQDE